MNNHTQGLLHYEEGSDTYTHIIRDESGHRIIANTPQSSLPQHEANARRLVACWNACDGIPTDDLQLCPERGFFYLAAHADQLAKQRDELLSELQNIANAAPREWGFEKWQAQFQSWAQSRARDAIAKAKGESS